MSAAVGELSRRNVRAALVLLLLADRLRGAGEARAGRAGSRGSARAPRARGRGPSSRCGAARRGRGGSRYGRTRTTRRPGRSRTPRRRAGPRRARRPGTSRRPRRGPCRTRAARAARGRRADGSGAVPRAGSREWPWVPVCLATRRARRAAPRVRGRSRRGRAGPARSLRGGWRGGRRSPGSSGGAPTPQWYAHSGRQGRSRPPAPPPALLRSLSGLRAPGPLGSASARTSRAGDHRAHHQHRGADRHRPPEGRRRTASADRYASGPIPASSGSAATATGRPRAPPRC